MANHQNTHKNTSFPHIDLFIYRFYDFNNSSSSSGQFRRWDFSCHPVSVFSYRLLDQIWKVPLFRVPDLSKELYSKVRALRLAHLRRTQLRYVHDFINTCRFADE